MNAVNQAKPTYNGYKNYNQWNVCLWLDNDESLYLLAQDEIKKARTIEQAARRLQRQLPARTPDGATYSLASLKTYITDNWSK
jgi:hypothetical protein